MVDYGASEAVSCAFMDQILKGLYRLGGPKFPAFLVVGSHCVVQVDAGPAFMGPEYLQDIPKVLGKGRGPDFLFHTHSHFDHVGSTPFLQRHFPEIKVGGSETFARRLSQTKTGKAMADLNRALVQQNNMNGAFIPGDFDYSLLTVEQILKEGDIVKLGGGASLEVIATNGHTSDSLSFFLPHLEAVLAGDALGIMPGDDSWVAPQFLSSYEDYLDSIERIRMRAPKTLLLGHHSVVRQAECERFFQYRRGRLPGLPGEDRTIPDRIPDEGRNGRPAYPRGRVSYASPGQTARGGFSFKPHRPGSPDCHRDEKGPARLKDQEESGRALS